jgi:hypothetical protein
VGYRHRRNVPRGSAPGKAMIMTAAHVLCEGLLAAKRAQDDGFTTTTSPRETANGILLTRKQARLVELALGVAAGDTMATIGTGYRGHGLYVWLCDYIDEGPHFLGRVHQTLAEKRVDIRGDMLREIRHAIERGKRDPGGRLGLGALRMRAWQGIE